MSRRARSGGSAQRSSPANAPEVAGSGDPARRREGRSLSGIARDIGIAVAAFGLAVGIAELAGAANLGVAFGIGQVVFAIAVVAVLTRG
jgi:hypothetical protein